MFKRSMKFSVIVLAMATSLAATAQHHAKHNMLLQGSSEVFGYHIVYKVPHNYQVILKVNFDGETQNAYLEAKQSYPGDSFVLLLDSMDISQISSTNRLGGVLIRRNASGNQEVINPSVTLTKDQFEVLYFDELPISLQSTSSELSVPACLASNEFSTLSKRSGGVHKCDDWHCDQVGKCQCYD